MNRALSLFEKLVESDSKYSNELLNILRMNIAEGPDTFADLLSGFVNFPLEEKQLLLETVNPIERIELLIDYIQRDLGRATVDRELQRQIQTYIDRRDRENYLREQLRIIQDELGETNPAEREADTYRDRIEALPLAEDHKQQLRREVTRMGQLSPSSSDYAVIKGHLDTVLQVPWTQHTEDQLDLVEGGGDPRRAASRSGEGEGARPRVPGRAQAQGRSEGTDPLLRRTSRRRQDLPRQPRSPTRSDASSCAWPSAA